MSNGLLSQEEIDALLQGVDSGAIDTARPGSEPADVRMYDLAGQDRIVRGRMPTLEMINERFVRAWRLGLFNLLRRSAVLSAEGIETLRFGEYLHTLPATTNLNRVRFKPLRGTGLVVFQPSLVYTVVDGFFGGDGRFPVRADSREFTPSELRVIQLLLKQTFADLAEAWSPVLALECEYLGSEANPQFVNVVGPREHVVICRFRMELEGGGGELHVVLPHAALEPVRELLDAGMQPDRVNEDHGWQQSLHAQLRGVELSLSSVLAQKQIDLRRLLSLKVGDILPIDPPRNVPLCVERIPLFSGEFGTSNGRNAVKILARQPPGAIAPAFHAPPAPVAVQDLQEPSP